VAFGGDELLKLVDKLRHLAPEGDRGRCSQLAPLVEGLEGADVGMRAPGGGREDHWDDMRAAGVRLLDGRQLVRVHEI